MKSRIRIRSARVKIFCYRRQKEYAIMDSSDPRRCARISGKSTVPMENGMADIREYFQKKQKRPDRETDDFKKQIRKHRIKVFLRLTGIAAVLGILTIIVVIQLKNQTYSGFVVVSAVEKEVYSNSTVKAYQNGFLTYSKDGISYTDSKGNAVWNQTYQMQSPIVSVRGQWVAAGDYNGHIIYDIDQNGTVQEIDTNLPIRSLTVSANGVVAAVLEDGSVTWINVYNPSGEKAVSIKTTMQKSGYPMSIALSDSGKLMQVAYLRVESGSMKGVVSFYNFDEVGQNYTDTMVSSYEYTDAVIPYCAFMNGSTAFSVADNELVIYEGAEIPKSVFQLLLNEEIQDVYYDEKHIGLIFPGSEGQGKYRLDVYDTAGNRILSYPFSMEYRDILFYRENLIIYNEAECIIAGLNGREKYAGDITEQTQLLKALGGNRYLAVTKDSLDTIEMK